MNKDTEIGGITEQPGLLDNECPAVLSRALAFANEVIGTDGKSGKTATDHLVESVNSNYERIGKVGAITFEKYLIDNFINNVIDHVLRAHHHEATTTFYIHPANVSGETLDFEVANNVLFEPLRLVGTNPNAVLSPEQHIGLDLNAAVAHVHGLNVKAGWWSDLVTGERKDRNVGELLCLVHSEISEAMEGHRKNQMDDKLPHRKMIEVELADAVIRILDIAGGLGLDLGGALTEKLQFNAQRADHKIENRVKEDGKKY